MLELPSTDRKESIMHRQAIVLFATALFAALSFASANAADLTLATKPRAHVASAQTECVRWVEQTLSWYNYCDPIRYPPQFKYGSSWAW
jgi:hypothetical protein